MQHIIGQPQTYTVSPIWYSSEEDGSFSSCLDELQPIRSVAATMAIISFIMDCPDRCFDSNTRNCFGPFDGSKDFSGRKPPLTLIP